MCGIEDGYLPLFRRQLRPLQAAEAVAKAVGIDSVHARMMPEDKQQLVRNLKANGAHVAVAADPRSPQAWAMIASLEATHGHAAQAADSASQHLSAQESS